jgi:hypothetical protein
LTLVQKKWSPGLLAKIMDTQIQRGLRAFLLGGLISCGLFYQQAQAAGITGAITFTGTVNLDTISAGTATKVTGWHGLSTTPTSGLPQVQDAEGDFATFVTAGDGVLFHAPWSFSSGAIASFWSVDGFTFDLISSSIPSGGQGFDVHGKGFVAVNGVGIVSGHGFDATPINFGFTTQDPSADGQFSFSASSAAVPEPATMISLLSGSSLLGALMFIRRRRM